MKSDSDHESTSAEKDVVVTAEPLNEKDAYRADASLEASGIDERKLMRKVDWHVIPWLALLYLLNFLDRGNVGNAKLYGLEKDLGITDRQYLIALTVFFFPYALLEPATNVLLRRLKPSYFLSFMIVSWGIVMTLHGVIHDYGGLVTCRVLLGLFESGMYPGIVFYISSWYKRTELGSRVAVFFTSATVAGAFSGLLASGIQNMHGIGGKPGWAWIFILEGLFTVIVGVFSLWVIQDFPETAKFLNEEERAFIIRRLQCDQKISASGEKFDAKYIWQSLKDWKTWVAMCMYAGFDGPLFAFSLFTPTIINQLGYTATIANLLSVPVYVWACLVTLAIGFLGDRIGHRAYINLAWVAGNVEGAYKRGVTLAMAIGFGNLNGAVTSNVYRATDAPWYPLGHGIVLAYIAIGFISSAVFLIGLKRANASKERGVHDEIVHGVENKHAHERNGTYASVEEARMDKGDRWSGFKYTY
ncbi:MFS general substrate transporter [Schizophyllum commune Loenen D]|nr:MFS general substrate transporter [Schizophyllum commune Loenen D]